MKKRNAGKRAAAFADGRFQNGGETYRMDSYEYKGEGYCPLVLTEAWQLAQLNAMPSLRPEALTLLDQHDFTDETFTLIRGQALLITYDAKTDKALLTPMQFGVTYNVRQMEWHNIAMEEGSTVLITEGRDAHLKGCNHIPMPEHVKQEIIALASANWPNSL